MNRYIFLFYTICLSFLNCKTDKQSQWLSCIPQSSQSLFWGEINRLDSDIINEYTKIIPKENKEVIYITDIRKNSFIVIDNKNILTSNSIFKTILSHNIYIHDNFYFININRHQFISQSVYLLEEVIFTYKNQIKSLHSPFNLDFNNWYYKTPPFPIDLPNNIIQGNFYHQDSLIFKGKIDLNHPKVLSNTNWKDFFEFIPASCEKVSFHHFDFTSSPHLLLKEIQSYANVYLPNTSSPILILKNNNSDKVINTLKNEFEIVDFFKHDIFHVFKIIHSIDEESALNINFKNPYITTIDNYTILSNNKENLLFLLEKFIIKETFINNEFIIKNTKAEWNGSLFLQIKNNKLYTCYIHHNNIELYRNNYPYKPNQDSYNWNTSLKARLNDSGIHNSIYKNEKILIAQDIFNQIYFINEKGILVNSFKLSEVIPSNLHHYTDIKTKTDRYLFSKGDKIYIFDSKGQSIVNSPIQLPSKATNEVNIVHFKNSNEIFAFIACTNNNYYAYDLSKSNQPLINWNPLINVGMIEKPLTFLESETQFDFIYINKNNQLVSLNRKAELRFPPIQLEDFWNKKIYINPLKNRLALFDGNNKLKIINQQGQSFHLQLANNIENPQLALLDIIEDEQLDYIIYNQNHIVVYYYDNNKIKKAWSNKFDFKIDKMIPLQFQNKRFLLIWDKDNHSISIINNQGDIINNELKSNLPPLIFSTQNGSQIITSIQQQIFSILLTQLLN